MLLAILILLLWLLPVVLHAVYSYYFLPPLGLRFKPSVYKKLGVDLTDNDTLDSLRIYEEIIFQPATQESYDGLRANKMWIDEAPLYETILPRKPQWQTHHGLIFKPPSNIHSMVDAIAALRTEMMQQIGISKDKI